MPGCLENMLTKSLLKNAKRDGLAKVKKMVDKSMEESGTASKQHENLSQQVSKYL